MGDPYVVNVSSVNDFMSCRFRWYCKWILNRVPRNESPALGGGKLLHKIFEDAAKGKDIAEAARDRSAEYRRAIEHATDETERYSGMRALQIVEDLAEALPLWKDKFPVQTQLEVEEPFKTVLPEYPHIEWLGRPDRVVVSPDRRIWHIQNRGLAASMNFGTYMVLAKRHYHEHLYAEHLAAKYPQYKYGGTVFNLIRKLKYRTNVGKKNEKIKTAAEMFFQMPMSVKLDSPLHRSVMMSLVQHVDEMIRVTREWEQDNVIPAPNERANGGFSGSMADPFFRVLIGEITLNDDAVFKTRENMYAPQEAEE